MDAFGKFLADLAQHEASTYASSPASPAAHALAANETRLLLQLRDEVLQSAVLVVVSAGIANALEKQHPKVGRHSLDVYAPHDSPYVKTLLDALLTTGVPLDVSRAIQAFTARIALARRMARSFTVPAASGSSVDAEILADVWRRAAASAIEAIDALNVAISGGSELGKRSALIDSTVDLLRMAEAGETTCLDPSGRVSIPGWAERRSEARTSLDLDATVVIGKILFKAKIRDASATGLGLEGAIMGKPGETITLKLYGDRQLTGAIAWNDGERFGVSLDQRLDAGDLLLRRY